MCDVTVGTLLKLVSCKPCLWDVTHSLYNDQEAKDYAWHQVCSQLSPEYCYMSRSKQEEYKHFVEVKWSNALSRHKGLVELCEKKSMQAENLMYLRNMPKRPRDDMQERATTSSASSSTSSSSRSTGARRRLRRRNHMHHECNHPKREVLVMVAEMINILKDDNLSFFKTIVPMIVLLSDFQRVIFRADLLKKLVELGNIDGNIVDPAFPAYIHMHQIMQYAQLSQTTAMLYNAHTTIRPRPMPHRPTRPQPHPRPPTPPPLPHSRQSLLRAPYMPPHTADQYPFFDPRVIVLPPGYQPISPVSYDNRHSM